MDYADAAIAGLYRASTGEEPWSRALQRVTEGFQGLGTQKMEPGEWMFCQDCFTGPASEAQPYYRNLLIPYGGRYSATMKVGQNDAETILIGLLSKRELGRFSEEQKSFIRLPVNPRRDVILARARKNYRSTNLCGIAGLHRLALNRRYRTSKKNCSELLPVASLDN
jgi:hypothetical protein